MKKYKNNFHPVKDIGNESNENGGTSISWNKVNPTF